MDTQNSWPENLKFVGFNRDKLLGKVQPPTYTLGVRRGLTLRSLPYRCRRSGCELQTEDVNRFAPTPICNFNIVIRVVPTGIEVDYVKATAAVHGGMTRKTIIHNDQRIEVLRTNDPNRKVVERISALYTYNMKRHTEGCIVILINC